MLGLGHSEAGSLREGNKSDKAENSFHLAKGVLDNFGFLIYDIKFTTVSQYL